MEIDVNPHMYDKLLLIIAILHLVYVICVDIFVLIREKAVTPEKAA